MPAVQPPARVLVSGATGYIAAWVVQNLLDRGYAVRGTVRSVSKGDFLKKAFASYGDRFELVVVEDIAKVSLSAARDGRSWHVVHRDRLGSRDAIRCAVSCLSFRDLLVRMGHSTRQSKAWMPSNTQRRLSTLTRSTLMVSRQEALNHPTD